MTCGLDPNHRQDRDVGGQAVQDHEQRISAAVQYLHQHQIRIPEPTPDASGAPGYDPASDEQRLVDFYLALFDLQEELQAMRCHQVERTRELLASKPCSGRRSQAEIVAAAEAAVAADERRILAFELPTLVHETPDQLLQVMAEDDDTLQHRLEAALEVTAQAPPSFRRFRDVTTHALELARHNQRALASQHATAVSAAVNAQRSAEQHSASADDSRRPKALRRQLAHLERVQRSQQQEIRVNLHRIAHLQARLAVIDAVEARRQQWAAEDIVRAAVLALGVAAAETLMERRLAPRLARLQGGNTVDPEAPTEPIPPLVLLASGEGG
jgi:hypothetical protein